VLPARLGGDEFTIVCDGLMNVEGVSTIGWDLVRAFQQPLTVDGRYLMISISVGASLFGPTALFDNPGFVSRELEEYLHLEGRYLARQVPPTEKCRVPAVRRALLQGRTIHRHKTRSLNQRPESTSTSATTGKSYRMSLHETRQDPLVTDHLMLRQGVAAVQCIR
jgi:hypothetical protein